MEMQITMFNESNIFLDEKTNELVAVVKFQSNISIEKYIELVKKINSQKDGTFNITLE